LVFASTLSWAASLSSIADDIRQGQILQSQGRFAEAEKLLHRAVLSADKLPDGADAEVAALSNLASVEIDLARMDEAVRLYDRALRILIRQWGEDSPRVQYHRSVIAELYLETGQTEEAAKLMRAAIESRKDGARDTTRALALDVLACVYSHGKKFAAAENTEREAISIFEELGITGDPAFAIALSHLAAFVDRRKRSTEALPYAERALLILKNLSLPQPAMEAETGITAAAIYARLQRPDDAEAAMASAVRTVERFYGPDHPRTGAVLFAQAAVLKMIGKKQAAREAQGRGDAIFARAGGGHAIRAVPVEALLP
jgi:tetratricopeptide (TPR) repeat protein